MTNKYAHKVPPDDVKAAILVDLPEAWLPTLVELRRLYPALDVLVGSPHHEVLEELGGLGFETEQVWSTSQLVATLRDASPCHVLLFTAPCVLPPDALAPSLDLISRELRCATVSYLSNVADFASFPVPDAVGLHQVENLDEVSITRRLRQTALEPAPLPHPVGPVVLLSRQALAVVGELPPAGGTPALWTAAFGAEARSRGMLDFLDARTYVTRPLDVPGGVPMAPGLTSDERAWLERRYPGVTAVVDAERDVDGPVQQVCSFARSEIMGLQIVFDGSCLGPKEMGTQVSVLGLIEGLAAREDVRYLGVSIPGPIPDYAEKVLSLPKVEVRVTQPGDLSVFSNADIVHRPFQVAPTCRPGEWRHVGRRTLISILDLIAYQVPGYHRSPADWFEHREATRRAARELDGVIVISEEAREQVRYERLPIDLERVFVVPLGVEHLRGDEPERCPQELLARGFDHQRFLLCLGANYSHKNRDLAIRVAHELRARGIAMSVVLAGAYVPYGSSRVAEARAVRPEDPVYVVPDVSAEERNWLLRHADLVLYPTGAEGFGFVPHEAAAFGTPTVLVPFGPLAERLDEIPVSAIDRHPRSLADACERLLEDPALALDQVAAIQAAAPEFGWDAAAAGVVRVYRSLLGLPARSTL